MAPKYFRSPSISDGSESDIDTSWPPKKKMKALQLQPLQSNHGSGSDSDSAPKEQAKIKALQQLSRPQPPAPLRRASGSKSDSSSSKQHERIKALRDTISIKEPVIMGTTSSVDIHRWTLFYRGSNGVGCIPDQSMSIYSVI